MLTRYKDWLETVQKDQEAALLARREVSTAKDQDELNERYSEDKPPPFPRTHISVRLKDT